MDSNYADLPDELWDRIKVWIPIKVPNPKGGQRPIDDRRVMSGIIYRLRTGCQWDAMPAEFGSGSTCFRRFKRWRAAGVFAMAHVEMLIYYDDKVGIEWDWASLDSASVKAPKGGTSRAPIRPIAQNSAQNAMS
jgi:transposase